MQFVSRAGEKLAHALREFKIDVTDKICADFGCSTGGFTDCLLQNGATKVYSVDTGYGVIEWNLRNNPQVELMERTNALHVELPEKVDLISIDVGWTRQKLIIPHALTQLKPGGQIVSLLKPHYEADKQHLQKGTVPEEHLPKVIDKVKQDLLIHDVEIKAITESPVPGKKGKNIEYLIWIKN